MTKVMGIILATMALSAGGSAIAKPPVAKRLVTGKQLPAAAQEAASEMVNDGLEGVSVAVGRRGKILSQTNFGNISASTQVPIASATKWLTGALVMQLVGEGKLSLDAPVSTWLPDAPAETGIVTLRQILSQTSGAGGGGRGFEGLEMVQSHRLTLKQSADELLKVPLPSKPGSVFRYGGPGWQIAGAVVEAVTGKTWAAAFQERIAGPLGMTHTYWAHLRHFGPRAIVEAETRNPTLQGGAVSTIGDYMKFLSMIAAGGNYNGKQIIARTAVAEMLNDQTATAVIEPAGASITDTSHYALGSWCDKWDQAGRCTRNSSLGAWGVYPWLDRINGTYGIVFMHETHNSFRLLPLTSRITESVVNEYR